MKRELLMKHEGLIAEEGLPFITPLALFTILSACVGRPGLAGLLFLLTFFVVCFFRNPDRVTPDALKQVISPADGKVIRIEEVDCSDVIQGRFKKISIFMNIFNVHVNRIPYSGQIKKIHYHKGKFLSANLDKASEQNEKKYIVITTDDGRDIMAVQIAGLIARRIVCWIKEGMSVTKGERFGLIRFGSRVEVFLPSDSQVLVKVGDKVKAGETPIGGLS